MVSEVGYKIKKLRTDKKMTLKELSEKTEMSIGFLSQLERGLSTIAVDSLSNIALALGVGISYFFDQETHEKKSVVIRSYEREVDKIINSQFIHYSLSNNLEGKVLCPRLIEILPLSTHKNEEIIGYGHAGEEFVYVIEGILTLGLEDKSYELFPGDTAHYDSTKVHNWANHTNRNVKILAVNTPTCYNIEREL